MFSDRMITRTAFFILAASLVSCSSYRRYAGMVEAAGQVSLSVSDEMPEASEKSDGKEYVDSVDVSDGPVIMNAIRDTETGEMTATDVITASKVVARFRNVAERAGKISFSFDITVPEGMIASEYQLRFSPLIETSSGNIPLDPVFITGSAYRKRQLRGYERYREFLESIITDSTAFIRKEQLETFLKRYYPETAAMKTDSSYVPEPLAQNLFGVSQAEALRHYTDMMRKRRNDKRMDSKEEMFRKYVKSPVINEVVLDTVMSAGDGSLMYRYTHTMAAGPGMRKLSVSLGGSVYRDGKLVMQMPSPEKLTYYISSLSTLADNSTRYVFKVVDRVVTDHTEAFLDFAKGCTELDTLSEGNSSELRRIRKCFHDVAVRKDLVLDSVIVTATCSPEGTWEYNARLAERRSMSVRSYIMDKVKGLEMTQVRSRSVPENWDHLVRMVSGDTVMSSTARESVIAYAAMTDKDEAERKISSMPEYLYMRESIYPRLRTVTFSFHLHRTGVKKDTIHTRVVDTLYMKGLMALKNLDYKTAATILASYGDYNSALALASSGYNDSALSILSGMKITDARTDYLEAILLARIGETDRALISFRRSVQKDPSMRHRANLDPELSEVVRKNEGDTYLQL